MMNGPLKPTRHPTLLYSAIAIVAGIVFWGGASPATLGVAAAAALASTTKSFGWFCLWTVLGVVAYCLFLAVSRYGSLRLGGGRRSDAVRCRHHPALRLAPPRVPPSHAERRS